MSRVITFNVRKAMVKYDIIRHLGAIALLASSLISCQVQELDFEDSGSVTTVSASFEDAATRVSLQQSASLALISRWRAGDTFDAFVNNDLLKKNIRIGEISEDGSSCSFGIVVSSIDYPGEPELFLASTTANPVEVNEKIYCNASLVRSPLSSFNPPVYARAKLKDRKNIAVTFKHYLTYEIVHVRNVSGKDISFSLNGYAVQHTWYRSKGSVAEDESFLVDTPATEDPIQKSPAIRIPAGGTDIIISSYTPNGNTINNARMVAEIDGQDVHSANSKTSDVTLLPGHAYHLYVTWDGTKLYFTSEQVPAPSEDEAVDLGLPSGIKWASRNVGASAITDKGAYFAWGEIQPKTKYLWDTYAYSPAGTSENLSLYNGTDGMTILRGHEDPVHYERGGNWRMPTMAEWEELRNNCTWTERKEDDVRVGYDIVSKINGKAIFLPATGYYNDTELKDGTQAHYWSSTLAGDQVMARALNEGYYKYGPWSASTMYGDNRYLGMPVRGVYEEPATGISTDPYVDLGLPSGIKWASMNVGALSCEEIGSRFAWGELEPKEEFFWANYGFATEWDPDIILTKYYGEDDFHYLSREDDIVYNGHLDENTDAFWRMPTMEEWVELRDNCDWIVVTLNGRRGYKIVSRTNGAAIFLPNTGYLEGTQLRDGMVPRYWSSTRSDDANMARSLNEGYYSYGPWSASKMYGDPRFKGLCVRGVYDDKFLEKTLTEGELIDLGLPSGIKWASCNEGTDLPEEVGNYYSWGEMELNESYDWANYLYSNEDGSEMLKYNGTDNLVLLEREDDIVAQHHGPMWRTPTLAHWQELWNNCTSEIVLKNGRRGYLLTSNINGNTLYIPISGVMVGTQLRDGMRPRYWSSNRSEDSVKARSWNEGYYSYGPWGASKMYGDDRCWGMPLRGIYDDSGADITQGDAIDLGLPSGIKWASRNVGAEAPEEFGNYYAWGEVFTKRNYTWETYKYRDGETITKYNGTDNLRVLESSDDVAYAGFGHAWRIPTKAEWNELQNNCDWVEIVMHGRRGYKITSRFNGASIFLPIAGLMDGDIRKDGSRARYWSSDRSDDQVKARALNEGYYSYGPWGASKMYGDDRYLGMSIRPVRD